MQSSNGTMVDGSPGTLLIRNITRSQMNKKQNNFRESIHVKCQSYMKIKRLPLKKTSSILRILRVAIYLHCVEIIALNKTAHVIP